MSEAVTLLPLASADVPEIASAVRESAAEIGAWMDWCTPGYADDDAAAWVSSSLAARETGDEFEFTIRSADGRLLGCCGLNSPDRANRRANLGYWVRTSETGRGVAREAVGLLAAWAFAHTDLERLEIMPDVENLASQKVASAAGAVREGIARRRLYSHGSVHDAVMFSIVRTDCETGR